MDDNAPYVLAIASTGSISKAARKMHLSQPALSQRLKQLECQLGVELFDRSCAPLAPTYAGTIYLEWARKAVEAEDSLRRDISAIASHAARRLQVGTSIPRANGMLPTIIERFYQQRHGCTMFLCEAGMPEHHNHLLSSAEIDCALFTPVRPEPSLFVGEALCTERMLLVASSSRDVPLATSNDGGSSRERTSALPRIDASCIARLPFIMPPRELKHAWIIRSMMDSMGVKLNVVFHSCSNEVTIEMVRRDLGVSLMPNTFLLAYAGKELSFYGVKGIPGGGRLYYNRRPDRGVSQDEEALVSIARAWVGEHPELVVDDDI